MHNHRLTIKPKCHAFTTFASIILLNACSTLPPPSKIHAKAINSADNEPVVALVLGGGGAKGFAHIGVIKTLEQNGIKPNMVVGSSVGSFVGALYASGMSANELETLALTVSNDELTDFTLSHQGIIEGVKLRNFVNTKVKALPIQSFPIRFAAVATEKHTLKKAVFTKGDAGLVVQASSSVPNLFIAPRIPLKVGKKYIDGGVASMVPVDVAKSLGADVVIAVNVMSNPSLDTVASSSSDPTNIWSLIDAAYTKNGKYQQGLSPSMQAEVNRADIVIRPNVSHIATLDTTRRREAIAAGSQATQNRLTQIKKRLLQPVSTRP